MEIITSLREHASGLKDLGLKICSLKAIASGSSLQRRKEQYKARRSATCL